MASLAEFYSANLGQEVLKGMEMMVQKGGWPHRAPRGYRTVRGTDGRSVIVVDPDEAAAVRRAFELYASGSYSFDQLEATLRSEGLPLVAVGGHMRRFLENPFYIGRIRWNGAEYQGRHPALIPEALFQQVAVVLKTRHRRTGRLPVHPFILRGLARCAGCRLHMTAEQHRRWGYYRCSGSCRGHYSNADRVHQQLVGLYENLQLTDGRRESISRMLKALAGRYTVQESRRAKLKQPLIERLNARQGRAAEAFADGTMPKEIYIQVRTRIDAQLASLGPVHPPHASDTERRLLAALERIREATNLREVHDLLNTHGQTELVKTVFEEILLHSSQIVSHTFQPELRDQPVVPTQAA